MRIPGSASLWLSLVLGCGAPESPPAPVHHDGFFQRYTDPDAHGLARDIDATRTALATAHQAEALQLAADLGSMLTTARREREARAVLVPALGEARRRERSEPLGWLLLYLATANQYLYLRAEAAAQFAEALEVARELRSVALEHYVLHHRGRFLVEAGELSAARASFTRALELRIQLNDPRQASSRRALEALDRLQSP